MILNQTEILMDNVQDVQQLALVLMDPFDLHIKERIRVDRHPGQLPDHLGQPFLVGPLDTAELLLQPHVLRGRFQGLERVKVGNPGVTDRVGKALRQ